MTTIRLSLLRLFIDLRLIRGVRVSPIWNDHPQRHYVAQLLILGRWRSVGDEPKDECANSLPAPAPHLDSFVLGRPADAWAFIERLGQ